jgi:hypothetical protein
MLVFVRPSEWNGATGYTGGSPDRGLFRQHSPPTDGASNMRLRNLAKNEILLTRSCYLNRSVSAPHDSQLLRCSRANISSLFLPGQTASTRA